MFHADPLRFSALAASAASIGFGVKSYLDNIICPSSYSNCSSMHICMYLVSFHHWLKPTVIALMELLWFHVLGVVVTRHGNLTPLRVPHIARSKFLEPFFRMVQYPVNFGATRKSFLVATLAAPSIYASSINNTEEMKVMIWLSYVQTSYRGRIGYHMEMWRVRYEIPPLDETIRPWCLNDSIFIPTTSSRETFGCFQSWHCLGCTMMPVLSFISITLIWHIKDTTL